MSLSNGSVIVLSVQQRFADTIPTQSLLTKTQEPRLGSYAAPNFLLWTIIIFSTLQDVLVGLCIYGLPKFDPRMCPRWALMRRIAEKRAYTLTITIFKCIDVMTLYACMNACHKLSPCRPSMDHFLVRAIWWMKCWFYWLNCYMWISSRQFLTNNSYFVWASSCQFKKVVRTRGIDEQWKERMHRCANAYAIFVI